ncbi:MAG: CpaF family protein, partial [Chloroflexota bacterium]
RLATQVRSALLDREIRPPDWKDADPGHRKSFFDAVRGALIGLDGHEGDLNARAQRISDALCGVGLLEPLLRDPLVEEIFVRGGQIAVERDGQFEMIGRLAPDGYFYELATQIAEQSGNSLRPDRPAVLTDLPGGERFTAIVPPLSICGTAINVRTFGRRVRGMVDLEHTGTFSKKPLVFTGNLADIRDPGLREKIGKLESAPARYRAGVVATLSGTILLAGEFSGGKTTVLNALSEFVPSSAPVAVLETFRELEPLHPFQLRTVAPAELPPGCPGVTLDWVLNTIYTRMNPGYIMVGEVVAREALQFVKAAGLGRKAITTIHGDSAEASLQRLEQLLLETQPELGLLAARSMIALAVNVVAVMVRSPRAGQGFDRILREIVLVRGLDENGSYRLERVYAVGGSLEDKQELLAKAWKSFEG